MRKQLLVSFIIITGHLLASGFQEKNSSLLPKWTPPPARTEAKTVFAPKPRAGNNIFKGEAENWLADAIIEVEESAIKEYDEPEVKKYIQRLGEYLVANSTNKGKKFRFVVLSRSEVNAMNVGGGQVYINVGLLQSVESEDELAGVLAHEIGHDEFGHASKTVTRQLFWMMGVRKVNSKTETAKVLEELLEKYRQKPGAAIAEAVSGIHRMDELEADRAGFYITYRAGYNPYAINSFLKKMEREFRKEAQESGETSTAERVFDLLFGAHPPSAQRTTALSWETNFVKMPAKDVRFQSAAFQEMKQRVGKK